MLNRRSLLKRGLLAVAGGFAGSVLARMPFVQPAVGAMKLFRQRLKESHNKLRPWRQARKEAFADYIKNNPWEKHTEYFAGNLDALGGLGLQRRRL